jgi:hypothetical protein
MNNIWWMNVETASKKLVHEVLTVVVRQVLSWIDDSVHICLHKISYDIYVFISSFGGWFLNINKSNYVFVIEEFQKFDLSHNSFRINQVFEGFGNFLDGYFCFYRMVKGRADNSISSMADLLNVFVLIIYNELCACTIKLCHSFWNLCFNLFRNLFFILLLLLLIHILKFK